MIKEYYWWNKLKNKTHFILTLETWINNNNHPNVITSKMIYTDVREKLPQIASFMQFASNMSKTMTIFNYRKVRVTNKLVEFHKIGGF